MSTTTYTLTITDIDEEVRLDPDTLAYFIEAKLNEQGEHGRIEVDIEVAR